jgi:hypothetical protein
MSDPPPIIEGVRMHGSFLVSPKMGAYLHHFDGGKTICVPIPSMAERYSYRVADRLAYTLRSSGFSEAHVADLSGMPATPQSIADAQAQASAFTVTFNKNYYFAGFDRSGQPQGTTDRAKAKSVSHAAAKEILNRLKKMFADAQIIEFSDDSDVEDELKALRGVTPDPEELTFKNGI